MNLKQNRNEAKQDENEKKMNYWFIKFKSTLNNCK